MAQQSIPGQSSDQIKQVVDRSVSNVLYEGTINIPILTAQPTGYVGSATVSLSALNLNIITPEFEVYFEKITPVGGGVSQFDYYKCPTVFIDTSGLIAESVQAKVSYQALSTKGITNRGTVFLYIGYYNRTSSSGQNFYYKIMSSDLLPSS